MYTWKSGIVVAATLAVGCSGELGGPMAGPDSAGSSALPPGSTGGAGPAGTGGSTANPGGSVGTSGSTGVGGSTTTGGAGPVGTGGSTLTAPSCTPAVPATSQIPRLTNAQYDRVVRDLLNFTALPGNIPPSSQLATDQGGGLSNLGWTAYTSVAEQIAAMVMADPLLKQNYLKCTLVPGDTTCLHSTIVEFGRRAFRRPLTTDEIARFDDVVARGATLTPTGTPEEIAELLLTMFLVSPSFLQRAEMVETPDGTGKFTLSNHEIASRLSFMLWGTIPDETLNQAADLGQLSTAEQIMLQAERMLQQPKAHDVVNAFHQYYLLMGAGTRWSTAQKDPTLFPTFNQDAVGDMTEETLRIFDRIAFTPGTSFKDYLLTPIAFVNARTAPFYGLDPAQFGPDLTEVTLDASRPGFLTRLGFLNNFSNYSRTSPIFRGAFISKQILGLPLESPPPGAEQTQLPVAPELDTVRKQIDEMTKGVDCAGCHHTFINPPGFVMEAFNSIGVWQTNEASTGAAIDTTANVTINNGEAPVPITTPAELMAQIAASPGAMRQYARKWVSFAYEREGHPDDTCVVDQLAYKMASAARTPGASYTILNLIADLTQTPSFRLRAVEVAQ